MKRPALTQDQRDQIATLRGDEGWTYGRIAEHLAVSEGSVSWHCLMEGIDKAGKPLRQYAGPMLMTRNGHEMRRYTPDEDAALIELRLQGFGPHQIGQRIGRRHNSVIGRLATLARHDERRHVASGGESVASRGHFVET